MDEFPKRGEVYWVSLDPTLGSEIKKKRRGVILSNDSSNKYSPRVIIGPIASSIERIYPFEAKINMTDRISKVLLDQIRSIDKKRLGKRICLLTVDEMYDIEKALKITLGLF